MNKNVRTEHADWLISTTSSPVSAISHTLEPTRMGEGREWYGEYPAYRESSHQSPVVMGKRKFEPSVQGYPYPYTSHMEPPPPSTSVPPPSSSSTPGPPTFVACTKCRHRKIKCGGQRPICENCEKKGLECVYDVIIKRRGPDKKPGGRMKKRLSGGVELAEQDLKPVLTTGVSPNSTTTPSSSGTAPHLPDEKPVIPAEQRYWNPSSNGSASIPPTASNSPETILSIPRSRAHSSSSRGAGHLGNGMGVTSYGYPPPPLQSQPVHLQQQPPFPRPYAYDHPPFPSHTMPPPSTHPSSYQHQLQHSYSYPPPQAPLHVGSGYHLQGSSYTPPSYNPQPRQYPPALAFVNPYDAGYPLRPGSRGQPPLHQHLQQAPSYHAQHPHQPPLLQHQLHQQTAQHQQPPPQQYQAPPSQPQETWSPSVVGKLEMADLVTGYDPVQHIAAGANLGLGMTTTSRSDTSNPHR